MPALRPLLTDLGLASNVALATAGLPVYLELYASPGAEVLVRLMAGTYVLPALALFAVARLLSRWPRIHGVYWGFAVGLAALSILRAVDTQVVGLLDDIDPTRLSVFDTTMSIAVPVLLLSCVLLGATRFNALGPSLAALAPIWALATAAVIAPLALAPGPMSAEPAGSVAGPVYVIVLDALGREAILRGGSVDKELFPSFHALASDGLLFTNATASYQEWLRTCESGAPYDCRDPSYLAAAHPDRTLLAHWIPRNARQGPLSAFGPEFLGGSWTPYTLTQYEQLIEDLDHPRASSTASFVHLLLPHGPYIFSPDGSLHGTPDRFEGLPEDDPETYDRYVQQVRFTDLLLGRFIAALKERGLYERATIVVTGDHGPGAPLEFPVHPSQLHPHVTLIMRGPGIPTGTTDIDYQHVDLTPTLTDLLGLEPVPGSLGVSVFATERPEREKSFTWRSQRYRLDPGLGRWVPE